MADIDPCIWNQSSKVRVIAKIRDFTSEESQSFSIGGSIPSPSISVHKPRESGVSGKYTVSVGDQPARYEVDYCYQQNEDIELIFSREIQPLISEVLKGKKASVIAYGARSSGKTYTIQGSEEKLGLATLALAEFFRVAEEKGYSIGVSLYNVFQEHVYDLLSSEHAEVQIWEVAPGKIKLEGLSRVKLINSETRISCKSNIMTLLIYNT
jgi:kinesin family protein 22